ncbi:MAG: hypothetical protein ACI9SX_001499 [Pseudoalteromonas tetraodonis]
MTSQVGVITVIIFAHNMNCKSTDPNLYLLILGISFIVVGTRLEIMGQLASFVPYWDDWDLGGFLLKNFNSDLSLHDYVSASNEHRMIFNRLISILVFEANQFQWDPMVMMVVNAIIWLISGLVLIKIALKSSPHLHSPSLLILIFLIWITPISLVNVLWGVQTHTYTMIFFSVCGCWYSGYPPLSKAWWFGILSLIAASLTLAGGTFAAFSVVAVQSVVWFHDRDTRADSIKTILAALAAALFGLSLILSQPGAHSANDLTIIAALTSFLRVMSWPLSNQIWPALVLACPVILLFWGYLRNQQSMTQIARFSFCLYVFIIAIALAMVYARGRYGFGPSRRYFEFLALGTIASFAALLQLRPLAKTIWLRAYPLLVCAWLIVCVLSIPWIWSTLSYTLDDRNKLVNKQITIVKSYLNTGDREWLRGKPFRQVPFPNKEGFGDFVLDFDKANILPYQIQTADFLKYDERATITELRRSPFIKNGTLEASSGTFGKRPYQEDVYGSYRPIAGGMAAVGKFTSTIFEINRPYTSIPVIGYFGYPKLSITLINVDTGVRFPVLSKIINSSNAEIWRNILVKLPRGYYRLEAEDQNSKLWVGFATPRSVGRLSFYTQRLINYSDWIWQLGIILLIFSLRNSVAVFFIKNN